MDSSVFCFFFGIPEIACHKNVAKKQCKIPTSFDIILLGIQNYFSASKPRQTNNQHYSIAIDGIETNDFSNGFQRVQSKQWFSMFLPTIGPTMG